MKKTFLLCMMAVMSSFLFTACDSTPRTASEIPLEDFFRNPEKSSYQISPDGKYFSFMAPYESRMNVFVQEVGNPEAVRVTSETERDVSGYIWANNGRILFLKDTGGDENYQLYGVDLDGSNMLPLTAFPGVRTGIIDDLPEFDDEIIIGLNMRDPQVFDPYRLNINNGEMVMLAENPGNIQVWDTDHEGKLRVAVALDGVDKTLFYRDNEDEEFRPLLTTNFKETLSPVMFTPDNAKLYVLSNIKRDKDALVIFDPQTAQETEVIYENDKYDISGVSYSRKLKKLTAASYEAHSGIERRFFDSEREELFGRIAKKVNGMPFGITDYNKNEDIFIVRTYDDRTPGAYYVYDSAKDELTHIADRCPWIEKENMAQMIPVTYSSHDGLTIEGYLTLPVGYTMKNARNLPVVVNPHGGPWARDTWGYNPEIQFLANRGYAVFQMNFRGSTGFGREFWVASFKEWGKTMQDDITDGVNWLVEKGIADPQRIAIYGASYGGYATLAGLAFTPDLYACGIDYVGVSNLFSFLNTIPPYWKPMLDMMYEMVGDPVADKELLENVSPVMHADKIVKPLFIAQGANDPRVNKDESDQMVEALRARGVEVEYMVKDNEGHGFYNEENQFDFYGAMERFLKAHLK